VVNRFLRKARAPQANACGAFLNFFI
jgi:hypothetical protein